VRRAVKFVAELRGKEISVSGNTCWTFNTYLYNTKLTEKGVRERQLKEDIKKRKENSKKTKVMSLKELSEYYKKNKK
jgi:hypothetical protein